MSNKETSEIDLDQDGYLDQKEIQKACKETGYSDNYDEIRATLKDVSTNAAGKIDVEEFIEVSLCVYKQKSGCQAIVI